MLMHGPHGCLIPYWHPLSCEKHLAFSLLPARVAVGPTVNATEIGRDDKDSFIFLGDQFVLMMQCNPSCVDS